MLARLAILISTLLFPALAAAQTTIELRATASVAVGAVRLDQIADITPPGPEAQRLGAMVVATVDAKSASLSRSSVKSALDAANPPVSWARTLLRGGEVQLTIAQPQQAPILAPPPASTAPAPTPQPQSQLPPAAGTFRDLIARGLADTAGVEPDSLTLRADTLSAADQQVLSQAVPANWKHRIQFLGATPTGRTQVRIEAFEADRQVMNRTLTIDALVTRDILIVAAPGGLNREQIINAGDLRLDRRTIPVNESARLTTLSPDSFVGAAVKRRIDAGKPIYPADAAVPKSAVVVKRGDDVTVSCISGGVILKSKAKALSQARDGELVTLQIEGSKKTFTARMNGPGKAIMSLDSTDQN